MDIRKRNKEIYNLEIAIRECEEAIEELEEEPNNVHLKERLIDIQGYKEDIHEYKSKIKQLKWNKYYKQKEILEYTLLKINELLEHDIFLENIKDHHYDFFYDSNAGDYYKMGIDKSKEWLGNYVFEVIEVIEDFEKPRYGEVTTDLTNPEEVVSSYVYIVGEYILENMTYNNEYFNSNAILNFGLDIVISDKILIKIKEEK